MYYSDDVVHACMCDAVLHKVKLRNIGKNLYCMKRGLLILIMRDEKEGRKEEASKVKQTTRQSNTAHTRQSLLQEK